MATTKTLPQLQITKHLPWWQKFRVQQVKFQKLEFIKLTFSNSKVNIYIFVQQILMPCNKWKTMNSLKTVVFAIVKLRKIISGPWGIQNLHYYITRVHKENTAIVEDCKTIHGRRRQFNTDQFNEINKENKVYGAY